ncbi:hypothetical protein, partial [Nocardia aurantiaca]|uniref:hypothetical protein n=1 Tax=Nocardia aurantiaca TaxID=2675850 RepID=UPI001E5BA69F
RTRKVLLTLRTSIFSKSNYRSSEHLSPFLRDDQLNRHDWPRLETGVRIGSRPGFDPGARWDAPNIRLPAI